MPFVLEKKPRNWYAHACTGTSGREDEKRGGRHATRVGAAGLQPLRRSRVVHRSLQGRMNGYLLTGIGNTRTETLDAAYVA